MTFKIRDVNKITRAVLKVVGAVSHRIDRALIMIFRILPIRNDYLVLQSSGDFWDNARTFYEYLISVGFNKNHKIIWLVGEPKKYQAPPNVRFVKFQALYPCIVRDYYIAVTKCFIYTHGGWINKWRKDQVFIHTTHSASQLKAAGGVTAADYTLCCGLVGMKRKNIVLHKSESCFPILGMPRLDLLFKHTDCIGKLFPEYQNCQVVLSMETFKQGKRMKDSVTVDSYAINVVKSENELVLLDDFLKENKIVLLVKIHHLQDLSFLRFVVLSNIRFLTDDDLRKKGIQLYELIENANILLTDYSSVFYDYLLLDRPIGFLIGDINEYKRGFIIDDPLNEMTGEKINNVEQLKSFLLKTLDGEDNYQQQRKELRDTVFKYQDGNNCKRLLDWLYENKIY